MSAIPGSVRFTGFIAPSDSTDTYAVHDEIYGRGGWRTVADITERDLITADRRRVGMAVRVLDDGSGFQAFYTLVGGITNSDWVEDNFGSTGNWKVETIGTATYEVPLTFPNTAYLSINPVSGGDVVWDLPLAADTLEGQVFTVLVVGNFTGELHDGMFALRAAGSDVIIWYGGTHATSIIGTQQAYSKISIMSNGVDGWGAYDGEGQWGSVTYGDDLVWAYIDTYRFCGNIPGATEDNIVTFDADGNIKDSGIAISGAGTTDHSALSNRDVTGEHTVNAVGMPLGNLGGAGAIAHLGQYQYYTQRGMAFVGCLLFYDRDLATVQISGGFVMLRRSSQPVYGSGLETFLYPGEVFTFSEFDTGTVMYVVAQYSDITSDIEVVVTATRPSPTDNAVLLHTVIVSTDDIFGGGGGGEF